MQNPRGTRDFGPGEMERRRALELRLRDVFGSFGYREVQTPTLEHLELFTAKSGEAIRSELYEFMDKGDRQIALRPELTAPTMRMYFADHQFDSKPLKWFYFGNCFRYDRPQAGRFREFWQFGCELIGAPGPLALAELIALADACLKAGGLENYQIKVGHVGLLGSLVDALELDEAARAHLMRALDKGEPVTLGGAAGDALRKALGATDPRQVDVPELAAVFGHLKSMGVEAKLDLSIARGLDYYTGVVFEVHCDALEAQSQIVGGGGYDLCQVFGAQPTPTIGFGLGFDRLLLATTGGAPQPGPELAMGAMGEGPLERVVGWAAELRRRGVRVDVDLLTRKPGNIAKWAAAIGARQLIILGARDLEAGAVDVKDLDTGEKRSVPLDQVTAQDWSALRATL